MKKVAVILSGCGVFDGAEIQEAVLTLLALDKAGASYQCIAPDVMQRQVINHNNQESIDQTRNVLEESARIARGEIKSIDQVVASDYDAAILPGGFGAVLNLCDYAVAGKDCTIQSDVFEFITSMVKLRKPLGFICIAPVMIPKIYGPGIRMTIGYDEKVANDVTDLGACHVQAEVGEIVVDEDNLVVSTPAYMLGRRISEVASGIDKLVSKILQLA